jgi:hypothetical protein
MKLGMKKKEKLVRNLSLLHGGQCLAIKKSLSRRFKSYCDKFHDDTKRGSMRCQNNNP